MCSAEFFSVNRVLLLQGGLQRMVIVTLLASTLPALRQQNWLAPSSKCPQDPSSLTTSSAVTLSHAVLFLQDHPPTSSLHPPSSARPPWTEPSLYLVSDPVTPLLKARWPQLLQRGSRSPDNDHYLIGFCLPSDPTACYPPPPLSVVNPN